MNNEPVAWIPKGMTLAKPKDLTDRIPLYTHPTEHDLGIAEAIGFDKGYKAATAKTLTDEEIMDAYVEHCKTEASGKGNLIDFARAILRKAQEK